MQNLRREPCPCCQPEIGFKSSEIGEEHRVVSMLLSFHQVLSPESARRCLLGSGPNVPQRAPGRREVLASGGKRAVVMWAEMKDVGACVPSWASEIIRGSSGGDGRMYA